MTQVPYDFYTERLNDEQLRLKSLVKKGYFISLARGFIFLISLVLIVLFWRSGPYSILLTFCLALIPFLYLLNKSNKIQFLIIYYKEIISINQNEQACLLGDYSSFPEGSEFIDSAHPYTFDLDIFGKDSIYQLINRSCTMGGAMELARSLKHQLLEIDKIVERQHAINELAQKPYWRQEFLAKGNILLESSKKGDTLIKYKAESKFHDEMMDWIGSPFLFRNKKYQHTLVTAGSSISIILLALVIFGYTNILYLILFGIFQLFIIGWNLKKINKIHSHSGRKSQILKKYGILLDLIERQQFESDYLIKLKNITGISNHTASKSLKKLHALSAALDNRLNILFAIIANAFFLYDLRIALKIEKWRQLNHELLPLWLETIYQFDSLAGFANFSFNNPDFCFPDPTSGELSFKFSQAGHPLILNSNRVNNDFGMPEQEQLHILTGANMAGKSTFLRTIGINFILATAGSVVCASYFKFKPISLHTSMRTNDSVQNSESYFYAELKRLKTLIDRLKSGEKIFIIIDEMLRGTNSKDKHAGSEALIQQLIHLNAKGLIATHDIMLGSMADKFKGIIANYRFEVEIKDDELFFDYILKPGISQNLNATFLMKKMGITL